MFFPTVHINALTSVTLMIYHLFVSAGEKSGSPQGLCKQCITDREQVEFRLPCLTTLMSIYVKSVAHITRCYDRWWKLAFQFMLEEPSRRAYNGRHIYDKWCFSQFIKYRGAPDIQLHYTALIGKVLPVIMKPLSCYFYTHIWSIEISSKTLNYYISVLINWNESRTVKFFYYLLFRPFLVPDALLFKLDI